MIKTRFLIAACFTLAAVPALAQSNSANEGSAAKPDSAYATPIKPASPQAQGQARDQTVDQQQTQRQANSDPYNMPQNRDAYSAQATDPGSQQNAEANGNGQASSDADSGTPASRINPSPSP